VELDGLIDTFDPGDFDSVEAARTIQRVRF
jgi:hypothetical protein